MTTCLSKLRPLSCSVPFFRPTRLVSVCRQAFSSHKESGFNNIPDIEDVAKQKDPNALPFSLRADDAPDIDSLPHIDVYDSYRMHPLQKKALRKSQNPNASDEDLDPSVMAPLPTTLPKDLAQLFEGFQTLSFLRECAQLGIFDAIPKNGEISIADIATDTDCEASVIYRVLRALSYVNYTELSYANELFDGDIDSGDESRLFLKSELGSLWNAIKVSHSSLSRQYCSGGKGYNSLILKSCDLNNAYFNLENSFRSGDSSCGDTVLFGTNGLYAKKGYSAMYSAAMAEATALCHNQIALSFDFSQISSVADIGGANGTLLQSILTHHSSLYGYLFDTSPVIGNAKERFSKVDKSVTDQLLHRFEFVSGDFLSDNSSDFEIFADVYILKWILHDWNDDNCDRILRNVRSAMDENGISDMSRLLIVEQLLPDSKLSIGGDRHLNFTDLHMLSYYGGRERTFNEYNAMLTRNGFSVVGGRANIKRCANFHMIEAKPM